MDRWKPIDSIKGDWEIDDNGDWVLYADAAARISEMEAQLAAMATELDITNKAYKAESTLSHELQAQLAAANTEIKRLTGELSPLGLPAPFILRQTDNTK